MGFYKKMIALTKNKQTDNLNYLFTLSIFLVIILRILFLWVPFFIGDEALILTIGGQVAKDGVIYLK